MATRVFISWSGDLSRKLGEALRDWLPASLQYVKPYFSPQDIEKGTKWDSEISKELEASDIGIVCLTQDNTEKPWILFEAGALSKSIDKARVCTLLFNLETTDVKGPLTSFQATRFVRSDFKKLVETINNAAGDSKLDPAVLDDVFKMWWPKLEEKVKEIIDSGDETDESERRTDRDILEEILSLSRMSSSRVDRSARMSTRALVDLVEGLDELLFALGGDVDPDIVMRVFERLNPPVEYLCHRADRPDAYERWASVQRRISEPQLGIEMGREWARTIRDRAASEGDN